MKKIAKKLSSRHGFTLAETLICVLILLMVCGIVGAAMPAASAAYTRVVDAANAQVLESTAITALRSELSTATSVELVDSKTITYRSANTGSWSKITVEGNGIKIYEYGNTNSFGAVTDYQTDRFLVSKQATTENLSISFDSVEKNGSLITIKGLSVKKDGNELAGKAELKIRTV